MKAYRSFSFKSIRVFFNQLHSNYNCLKICLHVVEFTNGFGKLNTLYQRPRYRYLRNRVSKIIFHVIKHGSFQLYRPYHARVILKNQQLTANIQMNLTFHIWGDVCLHDPEEKNIIRVMFEKFNINRWKIGVNGLRTSFITKTFLYKSIEVHN